jgi:hypothetical protein
MRAGRVRTALLATLILAVASIAFAPAAPAAIPFCLSGTGPGQCNSPKGLAADQETGHVYVVDQGNHRINAFESDGTFLFSFGSAQLSEPTWVAVDNDKTSASQHDVYVSADNFEVQKFKASGEFVGSFGGKGEGACQLMRTNDPVAVGPEGDVFVADAYDKDGAGPLHVWVNRVQHFDPEGKCLGEVHLFDGKEIAQGVFVRELAIDSTGTFNVRIENEFPVLRKYSSTGTLTAGQGGAAELAGLSVDAAGNAFIQEYARRAVSPPRDLSFITEYAPDSSVVRRFGYSGYFNGQETSLASLEEGGGAEGIFVTKSFFHPNPNELAGIYFLPVLKGPEIVSEPCHVKNGEPGSVRATVQAEVNPEGKATTVHVEYSDGGETKSTPPEALGGPADLELHEATATVEGLTPETTYHCRVIAENAEGTTPPGEEGSFETKEGFEFGGASVSEAGEEEATLTAEGNPLGLPATAQIEYVTDAKFEESRFAEAQSAPAEELDYGAGEGMQSRSTTLTGLQPATIYHWRLHVRNGVPPQGIVCPRSGPEPCPANEHVFRTYGAEEIADERAWELVSPGQKNSAEVVSPLPASGIHEDRNELIVASSGSGEAATFTSFTSFGKDAEGAPSASQYLSKRTTGGWVTENISPFGYQSPVLSIPFKGFAPDLGFAVFKVTEGALAPGCPEGVENLYLRDNASGDLTCLTPEVPQEGPSNCRSYAGSSEDGARVFFASSASYAGVPAGSGLSLYEWSAEGGLVPVSVLPGQSAPAPPTEGTVFGPTLGSFGPSNCQFGETVIRHVVSADGSKAFWTYLPDGPAQPSLLLARVNGAETIQLDAKPEGQKKEKPGAGPFFNGVFRAASKDGSVVYFTDTAKLILGSKAEAGKPDLYRYEFGKAEPLSDLTKGAVPGDMQGIIGASDDGSYLYFVAKGVLSGEEEGPTGQKATEGANNLYLYHQGKTSFIARLSGEDQGDWSPQPKRLTARVTPDGRRLAFLSQEAGALVGYNNTVAEGLHCQALPGQKELLLGGPLCAQGFLYDAEANTLDCATCNPTGARPQGPATLPTWSNPFEGPRYLSDDGSRFFFESRDALLEADENEERDVYEFERPGTGSCTTASGSYDPASNGCHYLVSSGKSEDESYFVDASSNGRDAFFATRQALIGWDPNDNFDVYDYREGGGFPEPADPKVCLGESCKAPASAAPAPASATTPGFVGPGNPKAQKPRPGRHNHNKKHRKAKKKPHAKKRGASR